MFTYKYQLLLHAEFTTRVYETPTERNNRCLGWQFIRKMIGMPTQNALYISTLEYYELMVPLRNEISV